MITRMQHEFIRQYLADPKRNAKAAAIRAGYSPASAKEYACRKLQDQEIQAEIDRLMFHHLQKLDVDAEMVISGIIQCIERAKEAGQGAWQSQAILRCYELLGRCMGMFSERVDLSSDEKLIERSSWDANVWRGCSMKTSRRRKRSTQKRSPTERSEPQPNITWDMAIFHQISQVPIADQRPHE